jgi:hypothetical protein
MSKIRYEFEEEDLDNYIINRAVENITKDIRRMFTDDIWIKNYKVDKIIKQAIEKVIKDNKDSIIERIIERTSNGLIKSKKLTDFKKMIESE